jgi:hypothetical protein
MIAPFKARRAACLYRARGKFRHGATRKDGKFCVRTVRHDFRQLIQ